MEETVRNSRGAVLSPPHPRVFELTVLDARLLVEAINDRDSLTVAEWSYIDGLVWMLGRFVEDVEKEDGIITD